MEMINVDVQINPQFYKKLSKELVKECVAETISKTTNEANERCKSTCPYDTGNLSRGHEADIGDEEGYVRNDVEYAPYVIYGTSFMAPRNYPQEVVNELSSKNYMSNTFKKELLKHGVS